MGSAMRHTPAWQPEAYWGGQYLPFDCSESFGRDDGSTLGLLIFGPCKPNAATGGGRDRASRLCMYVSKPNDG